MRLKMQKGNIFNLIMAEEIVLSQRSTIDKKDKR